MPSVRQSKPSGLAVRGLIAFVVSFTAARTFTTFYPDIVVAGGGIHFHHFWYGLAILLAAGWLGIASSRPQLDRIYAVAFGVGTGLIGDEVGLLLTFDDYRSLLTFEFFVAAVSIASIALLVMKYGSELKEDLLGNDRGEWLLAAGISLCAFSALPAAFGLWSATWVLLGIGVATTSVGGVIHWKFLSEA